MQHQVHHSYLKLNIHNITQVLHSFFQNFLILLNLSLTRQTGYNQVLKLANFREFIPFALVRELAHDIDVEIVVFEGFGVFGEGFDDVFEVFVGGGGGCLFLELGGFVGGSEFLEFFGDGGDGLGDVLVFEGFEDWVGGLDGQGLELFW